MERLENVLRGLRSAALAYSGGADSTFLAAVAHEVLGDRFLAVTVRGAIFPTWEQERAAQMAHRIGFRHRLVDFDALAEPGLASNGPDRCYWCKRRLFGLVRDVAAAEALAEVLDGSHVTDSGDYRPGERAAREAGVLSPLRDAEFTKADIRAAARLLGLPTADAPPQACLATRFPYGVPLAEEALRAVEDAEAFLRGLGFRQVRVRVHGSMARLELEAGDIARAAGDERLRMQIVEELRRRGFAQVALDLGGYRPGSLNEGLARPERRVAGEDFADDLA